MWCWWCCHPIEGVPLNLPFNYRKITDTFNTRGYYCSWECMKAHTFSISNENDRDRIFSLMVMLRKKMGLKSTKRITKAPNRYALTNFGGTLTIDEFRKNTEEYYVNMPGVVHILHGVRKSKYEKPIPTLNDKNENLNLINKSKTNNNTLKLKRPIKNEQVKETKSVLESMMGITRLKKDVQKNT